MDAIFHKTKSIFSIVSIARNEPRRFGKNGELLINYEETEEHQLHTHAIGEKTDGEKLNQFEHLDSNGHSTKTGTAGNGYQDGTGNANIGSNV